MVLDYTDDPDDEDVQGFGDEDPDAEDDAPPTLTDVSALPTILAFDTADELLEPGNAGKLLKSSRTIVYDLLQRRMHMYNVSKPTICLYSSRRRYWGLRATALELDSDGFVVKALGETAAQESARKQREAQIKVAADAEEQARRR